MNFRKNFRKISAVAIASAAVTLTSVVPAFAGELNVEDESNKGHSYKVYQIFTGTKEGENSLKEVKWGLDALIPDGDNKYREATEEDKDTLVPVSVLEELAAVAGATKLVDDKEVTVTLREKLDAITKYADLKNEPEAYTQVLSYDGQAKLEVADGYYILVDTLSDADDKFTSVSTYIVEVVGGETKITAKAPSHTVEKQVSDEYIKAADENSKDEFTDKTTTIDPIYGNNVGNHGRYIDSEDEIKDLGDGFVWSESADHSIGESFSFRVTGQLANDPSLASYKNFNLVLSDKLSEQITFEGTKEVRYSKDGGETWTRIDSEQYTETGFAAGEGPNGEGTWKFDVLGEKGLGLTAEDLVNLRIEVVYTAHLNENAIITTETGKELGLEQTNNNSVKMFFTRNPNAEGDGEMGETPEDHVFVFTYELNNFKTREDGETALAGAKFALYEGTWSKEELASQNPIEFTFDEKKNAYIPFKGGTQEIETPDDGMFTFDGLDAGEYTLVEVKAPEGYQAAEPISIVISAEHKEENEMGKVLKLTHTFDGKDSPDSNLKIINKKPSNLPQTGGAGTFMIYVVGGMMVVASGAYVASKKKSANN